MRRCLNCRKTYEDDLNECPHCGYKPRSKGKSADNIDSRNISSHSTKTYGKKGNINRSVQSQNISSNRTSGYPGSFYIKSGERLNNRYSVINVIGFGAFGVAYECFDNNTKRRVVVKEYMPSFLVTRSSNGRDVEPLSQEAEINFSIGIDAFVDESKKLSDNEIRCMPRMIEYFYQNNTSYVVTELVQGEVLSSIIKRKGRLSYQSTISIITGVLQGLRQLNKVGVIHSDICPDNIVVTSSGSAKLLDYNLSDFNKTIYTQRDSGKLRAGYSALEMYYPEMAQGPWTDVYAAAATMYKMLTGTTVASAIKRNSSECMLPPSKLGVAITPGAEKAMTDALIIDYKKRTQNPEDFLNGLTGDGFDNLSEDKNSEPKLPKISAPKRKRRDGNVVLNTVLIFLIIAIIGVAAWLFVSGVFPLPQFVEEFFGLSDGAVKSTDTDTDSDTVSSNYVGDFYIDEDIETDTDNLLDDIISKFMHDESEEESREESEIESEEESEYESEYEESSYPEDDYYSSEYYDDYSSYDEYPSYDDYSSEEYNTSSEESYNDQLESTVSEFLDDFASDVNDTVSSAEKYFMDYFNNF